MLSQIEKKNIVDSHLNNKLGIDSCQRAIVLSSSLLVLPFSLPSFCEILQILTIMKASVIGVVV